MVRQPYFHAAQHIQQKSHALPDVIAGFAQPRVASNVAQALGLGQRFTGMRQDVLLLAAVGATQPQIDHACQFRARECFASHGIEHLRLVALRQPHHLPGRSGRQ